MEFYMKKTSALLCFLFCFHLLNGEEKKEEQQTAPLPPKKEEIQQERVCIEKKLTKKEIRAEKLARKKQADSDKALAKKNQKSSHNFIAKYPTYASSIYSPIYRVKGIGASGRTLSFDDETIWEIASSSASTLQYWGPGSGVIIIPNTHWFTSYAYELENVSDHSTVSANLSEGPFMKYAIFITSIDRMNNTILLSDNTAWYCTPSWETNQRLSNWQPGQAVLIGENRGWFGITSGNILININENAYISASSFR